MTTHAARTWVEEHFPAARGPAKSALILAFGAGLDAGLAEAEQLMREALRRAVLAQPDPPKDMPT